jgi:hypothetical protein
LSARRRDLEDSFGNDPSFIFDDEKGPYASVQVDIVLILGFKTMIDALRRYKKDVNRENFEKVLESCGLYAM